jgi:hypothetical protein
MRSRGLGHLYAFMKHGTARSGLGVIGVLCVSVGDIGVLTAARSKASRCAGPGEGGVVHRTVIESFVSVYGGIICLH